MDIIVEYFIEIFEVITNGKYTLDDEKAKLIVLIVLAVIGIFIVYSFLLFPIFRLIRAISTHRKVKKAEMQLNKFVTKVVRDNLNNRNTYVVSKSNQERYGKNRDSLINDAREQAAIEDDELDESIDNVLPDNNGHSAVYVPDIYKQEVSSKSTNPKESKKKAKDNAVNKDFFKNASSSSVGEKPKGKSKSQQNFSVEGVEADNVLSNKDNEIVLNNGQVIAINYAESQEVNDEVLNTINQDFENQESQNFDDNDFSSEIDNISDIQAEENNFDFDNSNNEATQDFSQSVENQEFENQDFKNEDTDN